MAVPETETSEAILFIQQHRVSREMLYSEFEAVLDGFVPIPDLAAQNAHAVYLQVNDQLNITSAVFFKISFDSEGFADKRWNIPLQQLAENSARGPDLGGGPIRLACRSQCCINWHQQNLWDPEMSPSVNSFVMLKKVIKANRLGLSYREPEAAPAPQVPTVVEKVRKEPKSQSQAQSQANTKEIEQRLSKQLRHKFEQEFRDHMAQLLKEQRLRILTLDSKRKQEIQQLQLRHQKRVAEYRDQLEEYEKERDLYRQRNQELKNTIEGQASKIEGLREYFEHKLKNAAHSETEELQAMKNNIAAEVEAKVEAATTEIKEKLQMREIELMYRGEQEASYQDEIKRLREENQRLLSNNSEQLLEKLEKAGLNFVAYHPGAGHLTIPLADMSRYMDNPTAYAAEKCGVSTSHYEEWLEHYKSPVCRAIKDRGEICGEMIERVPTPSQFHAGENDRCDTHKTTPTQTFAALRG